MKRIEKLKTLFSKSKLLKQLDNNLINQFAKTWSNGSYGIEEKNIES